MIDADMSALSSQLNDSANRVPVTAAHDSARGTSLRGDNVTHPGEVAPGILRKSFSCVETGVRDQVCSFSSCVGMTAHFGVVDLLLRLLILVGGRCWVVTFPR